MITTAWRPGEGLAEPTHGSSFIIAASLTGAKCPPVKTILTYSQAATNEDSPHYADQTRRWAQERWYNDRFCRGQQLRSPGLRIRRFSGGRRRRRQRLLGTAGLTQADRFAAGAVSVIGCMATPSQANRIAGAAALLVFLVIALVVDREGDSPSRERRRWWRRAVAGAPVQKVTTPVTFAGGRRIGSTRTTEFQPPPSPAVVRPSGRPKPSRPTGVERVLGNEILTFGWRCWPRS